MTTWRALYLIISTALGLAVNSRYKPLTENDVVFYRDDGTVICASFVDENHNAYAISSNATLRFAIRANYASTNYLVFSDTDSFNVAGDWTNASLAHGRASVRVRTNTEEVEAALSGGVTQIVGMAEFQMINPPGSNIPVTLAQFPVTLRNDIIRTTTNTPTPITVHYTTLQEVTDIAAVLSAAIVAASNSLYSAITNTQAETDPVWTAEKSAYATGTPVYAELDPVWESEKASYATGTPVYAETDPVWESEKASYATGTPLYAYTETDGVWTAAQASGFAVGGPISAAAITNLENLTAKSVGTDVNAGSNLTISAGYTAWDGEGGNGGNLILSGGGAAFGTEGKIFAESVLNLRTNPIENVSSISGASGWSVTGTPIYAETDPVYLADTGALWTAINDRATGTPVYVESDPVYTAASGTIFAALAGAATGTPVYVESDPVYLADTGALWAAINDRATGTPVYVESDPIYTAASGTIFAALAGAATGTPVYVESDPVYLADTGALWTAINARSTGTPVYVEADPVWAAAAGDYLEKTNGTIATGAGSIAAGDGAVAAFRSVSLAPDSTSELNALAGGYLADAKAAAVAWGIQSKATNFSVAVGPESDASHGQGDIAVGYQAVAYENYIVLGRGAVGGKIGMGAYGGFVAGYGADGSFDHEVDGPFFVSVIGQEITNATHNNSMTLRGDLYLEYATGLFTRASTADPWTEPYLRASATGDLWTAINDRSTGTPVYVESDPVYLASTAALAVALSGKVGTSTWATAASTTDYWSRATATIYTAATATALSGKLGTSTWAAAASTTDYWSRVTATAFTTANATALSGKLGTSTWAAAASTTDYWSRATATIYTAATATALSGKLGTDTWAAAASTTDYWSRVTATAFTTANATALSGKLSTSTWAAADSTTNYAARANPAVTGGLTVQAGTNSASVLIVTAGTTNGIYVLPGVATLYQLVNGGTNVIYTSANLSPGVYYTLAAYQQGITNGNISQRVAFPSSNTAHGAKGQWSISDTNLVVYDDAAMNWTLFQGVKSAWTNL